MYYIIVKLIISLIALMVFSCKDTKPNFVYGDKVVYIDFNKGYIDEQFNMSFNELQKICNASYNECTVFQENECDSNNMNCVYQVELPNSSSEKTSVFDVSILYDCFSKCYYYFTDTNSNAAALAIIANDYNTILTYEGYPFLRRTDKPQSWSKNEKFAIYPAYITAEDANQVLFGERIYNRIAKSRRSDTALDSANTRSVTIDFYANNQNDGANYLSGLLFVNSH